VTVVVRTPAPPLAGLVRSLVYRSGEQPQRSVEKILPSPQTGLWVNLNRDAFRSFDEAGRASQVGGAMLAGPASRASVIEFEQGHAHVCVTFALGAASRFVAAPLALARDEMVPLEVLWGAPGASLRERLLEASTPTDALAVMEAVLLGQLTGADAPDPAVLAAAGALSRGVRVGEVAAAGALGRGVRVGEVAGAGGLGRGVRVGEVAADLGLLPRTLRRRFTAAVGLTPKRFARVQRMQRLVRDLDGQRDADWAALAAWHGYADQSHLADEFRELAGVTPGEYLRSRVNGPNHLRVTEREGGLGA
jgi:AraC-like DNA-binding protein